MDIRDLLELLANPDNWCRVHSTSQLTAWSPSAKDWPQTQAVDIAQKALTLLKQPKCKTCGDTRIKWIGHTHTRHRVSCPDCQQPKDETAKFFEQTREQPTAGEYETRTIENTYICPCGNIFVEDDDYDTLGSESGVLCPNCGNEKFQTVKSCLDRAEAINKDLLEGCKKALPFVVAHDIQQKVVSGAALELQTLIAKATKEGE